MSAQRWAPKALSPSGYLLPQTMSPELRAVVQTGAQVRASRTLWVVSRRHLSTARESFFKLFFLPNAESFSFSGGGEPSVASFSSDCKAQVRLLVLLEQNLRGV